MSGFVPKIKVETEKTSRPTVSIKNPISVGGIDIIKDSDSDNESAVSGSTIEPQVSLPKKHKSQPVVRDIHQGNAKQPFAVNAKIYLFWNGTASLRLGWKIWIYVYLQKSFLIPRKSLCNSEE